MSAPRRIAYEVFATPIDLPRRIAQPFPHDYQRGQREAQAQEKVDNNEKIVGETARMAETLTKGASQTQCVFSDEDVIPGTSIAGVSGRLGDAKLVSMQRMVMDSVPKGSQVKIIFIISKENGNNGQAGAANNAVAAEAGPADNDRIVQGDNAVQDRIRVQIRQHGRGQAGGIQADENDEEDDISPRPRKRRRLGTPFPRASRRAMAPMHVSPGDVKAEEDEDEDNSVKNEGENLEERDEENGGPPQQQGIPGFALLSPAEMLATARRERLMHGDEQIKDEPKKEVKEENDAEALFFSTPDEVIDRFSRSHPSLQAMDRETRSLYGLPSSFPSPARPAHASQQNNASDNDDGDDDNNNNNEEESFQTRYAGISFDEFLAGHAGPFSSEDPYPRLRSLNDGTNYPGYH
ncbi:hypothetical protein BDP81DRAFT_389933 [Colletotrichum phormii]|uniref:Uncharacterized protein n=1 Tax=Colletotrichum phormii TaxID=359342 RepID=A0AAJ0A2U3_9PEZI|nr:uncharacterized protein BDP81DRAFT_389933 [Colletotrichum phormii]KAK1654923.1 hypothetical protein BDP81DRAFT_389933 [Colletotrichum phormii]